MSRINQKLIRDPGSSLGLNLEEIYKMVSELLYRTERLDDSISIRKIENIDMMVMDDLFNCAFNLDNETFNGEKMALGLIRSQFPWIYDMGIETINVLRSQQDNIEKVEVINQFEQVIDITFRYPMMNKNVNRKDEKKYSMYYSAMRELLNHFKLKLEVQLNH